jgi:hypothetical protein
LRREAFEQMSRGISLGGGPYYKNREDLHDRPNRFGGTGAG